MDVRIGEIHSDLQVTDSESLLAPQVLDRVAQLVARRVKDELQREERRRRERIGAPRVDADRY